MNKKLFIGSFPIDTTEQVLKDLFSKYGQIFSLNIVKDGPTGISRGFAFVEMATEEAATQAIEKLNGFDLNGRNLVVKEALSQPTFRGNNRNAFNRGYRR